MKKLAVLAFLLTACEEPAREIVAPPFPLPATVSTFYQPMWIQTVPMGKSFTTIVHPEVHRTVFSTQIGEFSMYGAATRQRYQGIHAVEVLVSGVYPARSSVNENEVIRYQLISVLETKNQDGQ